ncbi:xanthine dehydrogenase family protein molybdopterin-binding subunit [Aquabacter spiritensis]|uniref:CO/xanthine dehydrogenase Mo-binding subunit n=1 Tax=Aquabacter spiritensis TaxID=933073 RepID=A0A4R3LSM9_9HYPH|nr:molybdopterin cofactor-binding domain-containing protein [Aquabacter spiritensis]TCT03584.1 CO/xanthine dehydrogenase Mo-binding subunit [Aquabacter spiritensis]
MSHDPRALPAGLRNNPRLSTWVRFAAARTVIVTSGKVEIGQGIATAMAQIAAEELDVALDRVRIAPLTTAGGPDEGITSGSRSVGEGGAALRQACAEIRHILIVAAAARLGCSADAISVADGAFLRDGTLTALTYWDLPHATLLERSATGTVAPKPPAQHRIVGRPAARRDLPDKVMGRPRFLQDIDLPGMLYGRVVRPPTGEVRLVGFDAAKLRAMPGIIAVIEDGSFLGIVAAREEQAVAARAAALKTARWEDISLPTDSGEISDWLVAQPNRATIVADRRDGSAPKGPLRHVSARFTKPYLAHGAIGPSCALARAASGGWEIWSHSQSLFPLREDIARVLQVPLDQVLLTHAEGSGCYGHNGADDVALDAVLLSRAVGGRPVQVQWMREDEFAFEPYGPAMVVEVRAALDIDGAIAEWELHGWSNGHLSRPGVARTADRSSALLAAWTLADPVPRAPQIDPPLGPAGVEHGGLSRNAISTIYDFPTQKVVGHLVETLPLRASSLRAIGAYANIFAIESFLDELALAAGADPLDFRLRHLADPRAKAVLELAAARAGWTRGAVSDGTWGRGLAVARYSNHLGYFAVVIDLSVDPDLRVTRAVAAVDVGQVVNPDGVINQAEGGIVQAISWTLKEEMRFARDGTRSVNWEEYPILGFSEVPDIEVHLIANPEAPPLGAGEMTMGPTAAAIANALAHALEARVRDLPITRARLLAL